MTTYAELAARLLREAATMFRALTAEDPDTNHQLSEFSRLYDQVADLVETNPLGRLDDGGDSMQA